MAVFSLAIFSISKSDSVELPPALASNAQPVAFREQLRRRVPSSVYVASAELGAIGLVGTLFNTQGLSQVPGLTGAVLLAAVNIFTPLTSALFGANAKEREVGASTWLSCVVALAASTFALLPEGAGFELPAIGVGESEVLAAAFFFSAAKVRLSSHLKLHDADTCTVGRLVGQAGLAAAGLGLLDETNAVHELLPSERGGLGMSLVQVVDQGLDWTANLSGEQIFWIVASAMLSGACALFCQSKGQSVVPAPRAQVFFSTSPLFGALWALLLLREPITAHELQGGAVLLLGIR
ncbi:hypothetical protein TeGR_g3536 [Tetraparma gracilis]|uniref:EamA domain-containing protein n=1 Tax=Tetraparma gracilis TaxID=2962635 RepID=A0ABQ6M9Q1_9STRA|nr:hypothetical protein TeGR_g3536 [Tetraparma gracilis]